MGKAQRDKGGRIERKLVHLLAKHDIASHKIPLSGATGGIFSGDIRIGNLVGEIKGRAKNNVFWRLIEQYIYKHDLLFLWEDRKPTPLVVMPFDLFVKLYKADNEQSDK